MLYDKYSYDIEEKRLHYRRHIIKTTTIYLSQYKSGLRIVVKRFTLTQTAEIFLLFGDNINILTKVFLKKAIKPARKQDIINVIDDFVSYALKKGLLKSRKVGGNDV